MCWSVEVPLSPKDQSQDDGFPVEVSVNLTASGAGPAVVFVVKAATGAGARGANFWMRPFPRSAT